MQLSQYPQTCWMQYFNMTNMHLHTSELGSIVQFILPLELLVIMWEVWNFFIIFQITFSWYYIYASKFSMLLFKMRPLVLKLTLAPPQPESTIHGSSWDE